MRRPLPEPIASADHGLYRIYWTDGSSSLAAIGINPDGSRWIGPTNWVGPATETGPNPWWHTVDRLVPLVIPGRPDRVALALAIQHAAEQLGDGSDYDLSAHNWIRNRRDQLADAVIALFTSEDGPRGERA